MRPSELKQQERAIDDALSFAAGLDEGTPEQAMVARYVCVLASGFLEDVVRTRLAEVARLSKPRAQIESYVESTVDRFQNPVFERILEITGRFSEAWRKEVEELDESIKHTINSIVANRNLIAHGRHSGVSLTSMNEYVQRAKKFMNEYNRICR